MNLNQIHQFEKGKFMFRLINKKLPSNFEVLLSPLLQVGPYNLRSNSNGNINESFARTNYGYRMIQTSGARLWNNIPNNTKQCESFKIFVDKYKNHILHVNGQQSAENL